MYTSSELEHRLERWADWARSPAVGSCNGSEGYMRERLDKAADSAEMTDEIAVTERAVARAKNQQKAYWQIISRYYLGRLSIMEIAALLRCNEDGLKRLLEQAKACVHEHIVELER